MQRWDFKELEQLALLAELARPLAHECNNFLNNLMLQLALSEKAFPESCRAEWANIRREGKKLASLFQQWQRQRKQSPEDPQRIDLNELVHDTVEELRSELPALVFHVRPAGLPLWLSGYAGEAHSLISLLLRYAVAALQRTGAENPAIEIQLATNRDRILLRLFEAGVSDAKLQWADFDDLASSERATLSLHALTCKSLVERLEGNIRIEPGADPRRILAVDLPLAAA